MRAWAIQHATAHLDCADVAVFLRDTRLATSHFTPWHRDLLGAFANRAVAAIERAQRHEDVRSACRG